MFQPARSLRRTVLLIALFGVLGAHAQTPSGQRVVLTVTDENGIVVPGAEVTLVENGQPPVKFWTDSLGRCQFVLHQPAAYDLHIAKPGYYEARAEETDAAADRVHAVLTHEQMVKQQVDVSASVPGIDPQQISENMTMNTPEIVNVPYPTNRDIRNLLPFFPGVIADVTGQVHVVGSETWQTLDMLDGFDVRSPVSGNLAMRVSTDAVRSIDVQTTRYPVEFGRATGGLIAYYTGMGDDKFRFNTTDFTPSFRSLNGIRFDKWIPRETFSGPIVKGKAWFFDGLETEYDNIYIPELPANADSNQLIRGSNLLKFQVNASLTNSLTAALLANEYHSPYDGISALVPQQSTTKRNTIAWLPYLRDQQRLGSGTMLDLGIGVVRFRDGYEPHIGSPYEITPETSLGSYFENATSHSQRVEGTATIYVAPLHWGGRHEVKAGFDADHVSFGENVQRAPVNYLREDGTLLRRSTFAATPPFTRNNAQYGAYAEDRWTPHANGMWKDLLIEPGLRFDWDEIVRRPLFSPRIAGVYAPPGHETTTKISAGAGIYYEHTQLEYLERALAGMRTDTYFQPDGVTPVGPPVQTTFTYDQTSLHEARALNWSVGVEQKLPWSVFAKFNFVDKRIKYAFTYVNATDPTTFAGNYVLTDGRRDHDSMTELEARKTFGNGYTLFAAYTHSYAHTNAALEYSPTVSVAGPQQSGPLPWDAPNRVLSWGWLPFDVPLFRKSWDFVYTLDWHTGFPITSVSADQHVLGAVGSQRFPDYVSFSPGLEWRFHLHGYYFGLRGVLENATNSLNPTVVNNNVDSPAYLTFSERQGRAFTTRIRLIESK